MNKQELAEILQLMPNEAHNITVVMDVVAFDITHTWKQTAYWRTARRKTYLPRYEWAGKKEINL